MESSTSSAISSIAIRAISLGSKRSRSRSFEEAKDPLLRGIFTIPILEFLELPDIQENDYLGFLIFRSKFRKIADEHRSFSFSPR